MLKRLFAARLILATAVLGWTVLSAGCSLIFMPTESLYPSDTDYGTFTETTAGETLEPSSTTETGEDPSETSSVETTGATETIPEETTVLPPEPTPVPTPDEIFYSVKFGDSLAGIARMFSLPVDAIIEANDITDPDLIYPEQILIIPVELPDFQPSDYSNLDNRALSWWYQAPGELNQDLPAAVSSDVTRLLNEYGAVWQLPRDDARVVYITMDAGYEYGGNTGEILDIAEEKGVKITFFVTGSYIFHNPGLVMRMVDEGHLVGNHTESHLNQPETLNQSLSMVQSDIAVAEMRFASLTGRSFAPYLRPPAGAYSVRSLAVLHAMGYKAVFWSFGYRDWLTGEQPDPEQALAKILGQLHNGSVILLHTVSNTNVEILGRVIDGIRERGYSIELLP